ncbi:MAG: alpha/beta fold hydrolase [Roseiflexaceae bacterium]|nr:alpha/beta fold hydrolase [Roseiflexaceae bacterium]
MTTLPETTLFPVDPATLAKNLYAEVERLGKAYQMGVKIATGKQRAKVAQTPKEAIWTLNKTTLYHYYPQAPVEKRKRVPLLLVFALINKPYIFDLRPGNSFVEYMVQQGYNVYLIDWGAPGPEDAHLTFEDYALEYLPRAVRRMQMHSGQHDFSMLGWCIGATLSAIYAAMRPDDGLRNLILLTAPIDFSNKEGMGPFPKWLREEYFNLDAILEQTGNYPGEMIDIGSKLLKPVENLIGNYLRLLDNLDDPKIVELWQAMNTWVNDGVPFAGAAYRQLVVDLYRENRLMNGTWIMRGRPVNLGDIKASLLNIIARQDHIVPPCQSETILDRVSSTDKHQIIMPGGHIGIMAGSGARRGLWPQIDAWLADRSM